MKRNDLGIKALVFILCFSMAASCFCMCTAADDEFMALHVFSVEKADAMLIHSQQGTVLIDTGEKTAAKTILDYLEEKEITSLDYLIITHFDKDHVGGAAKILRNIEVGHVLQSNCPKESPEYTKYLKALEDKTIIPETVTGSLSFELGPISFKVTGPGDTVYANNESNNSSLITTVEYGENSFLFMGDAQSERIQEFLNSGVSECDFIQIPYHGKYDSLLKPLLSHCMSKYAVISCSDTQPENAKTVKLLEDIGADIYLTRIGAADFVCDGNGITAGYTN